MFSLFHGTTLEGYKQIIYGNYNASQGSHPWSCSDSNKIYFYDPVAILNSEFNSDSKCEQEANDMAQKLANEAGQIVNALSPNPATRTVVLEFIFQDDEIYFEDIEEDLSCPNMLWAVQMDADKFNAIMKGDVYGYTVKVHFYKFFPKLSLCYIIPLAENEFFNFSVLSIEEKNLLYKLRNMECYNLYDNLIYDLEEEESEKLEFLSLKFLDK